MNKIIFSFILLLLFVYGCSDSTTSADYNDFSVSAKTLHKTYADSTFIIDTVLILIKDVTITGTDGNVSFKNGIFSAGFPADERVTPFATGVIEQGKSFNGISFGIHQLQPGEAAPNPAFKVDSTGYSVIVRGSYNKARFTYRSQQSYTQQLALSAPFTADAQNKVNLTLTASPYSWFYRNGKYMDPNNSLNFGYIEELIKNPFTSVFLDDNQDGKED